MTELELAWLAGLLEGEGCFTQRAERSLPIVEVKMTDRDVIDRVARMFERGVTEVPAHGFGKLVQYRARLQGVAAADLMRRLLPHMGERRAARIRELLGEA